MYIRCRNCKTSTRVPLDPAQPKVTCVACGHCHDLGRAAELGKTSVDRYRTAQAFAEKNGTDLASAYSVLLGVMSIDEADKLDETRDGPDPLNTENREPREIFERSPADGSMLYDASFQDAVAGGYLSIRMAVERGDRVTFASRVARRHGLGMSTAFDVADNRIGLREAIARKTARETRPQSKDAHSSALRFAATLVAVVGAVVLVGWGLASNREALMRPQGADFGPVPQGVVADPSVESVTEIRADAEGRLTRLVGPSQHWVLNTYCSTGRGGREPIRTEPSGDGWLGVFKESDETYAISIQKHPHADSWVAGDGTEPIPATKTPL